MHLKPLKKLAFHISAFFAIRANNTTDSNILGILLINVCAGKASFNTWDYVSNRVTGSKTINDGNWHHLADNYNVATGVANLYVDGKLDRTDMLTGSTANVRVYNYELSSTQVKIIMNGGEALRFGPTSGSP